MISAAIQGKRACKPVHRLRTRSQQLDVMLKTLLDRGEAVLRTVALLLSMAIVQDLSLYADRAHGRCWPTTPAMPGRCINRWRLKKC